MVTKNGLLVLITLIGAVGLNAAESHAQISNNVWLVDWTHGSDSNDGQGEWEDAFKTLQKALDEASSGHEIWVAAATYFPEDPFDANTNLVFTSTYGSDVASRMKTFKLTKNVSIYGGFLGNATGGGEDERTDADPANNLTILSGDFDQNDGQADYDENAYHVLLYVQHNTDEVPPNLGDMVIDGFVITGGVADGGQDVHPWAGALNAFGGGALIVYEGHVFDDLPPAPVFSRCVFKDNFAESGGAAFGGYYGGCRILDCRFENNHQTDTSGTQFSKTDASGGAVNVLGPVVVLRSTFVENTSVVGGGAIHQTGAVTGGELATFLVSNCSFYANEAPHGGAIDALGSTGPGIVVNSLFVGNEATNGNGGALNQMIAEAHGCTFVRNHASWAGGGVSQVGHVTNCIFWENTDGGTYDADELWKAQANIGGGTNPDYNNYNLIQDWDCNGLSCTPCCTPDNFDVDPGFADEDGPDNNANTLEDNDYRLGARSLAINMGDPVLADNDNNGYFPFDLLDVDEDGDDDEELTPDRDIEVRVIDSRIDVGAYENDCIIDVGCPGDCDGPDGNPDGRIDDYDLDFLMKEWCTTANCCQGCCSDTVTSATFAPPPDGKVDGADLAYLLGEWGTCCESGSGQGLTGGGGSGEESSFDLGPYEGTYFGLLLEELIVTSDDELAAIVAEFLAEMMNE